MGDLCQVVKWSCIEIEIVYLLKWYSENRTENSIQVFGIQIVTLLERIETSRV